MKQGIWKLHIPQVFRQNIATDTCDIIASSWIYELVAYGMEIFGVSDQVRLKSAFSATETS